MTRVPKQVISYTELLGKVQAILAAYPECRSIHIDGIEIHREQKDGANWHVKPFRRSGSDNDLPTCREKLVAEIRHLRTCYDVEPKR